MQLRQKYTIDNITYENELFISEKDNVNITAIMEYFFNVQKNERNKREILHGSQTSVQNDMGVVDCNSEISSPDSEESVKTTVETEKEHINKVIKNIPKPKENNNKIGYYIKYRIGNNVIERWTRTSTEANAKAVIYNYVSKLKKEYECEVEYEFLEIQPMTKEEFDNRNKSAK